MMAARTRQPASRPGRLRFDDAPDWPNREASRFIEARGVSWHYQRMGEGPKVLLLHGTGSSTHSWRAILPLLATRFEVLAPDLPGHAFTDPVPARRMALDGMAQNVSGMLQALHFSPDLAIGHSAGAAILVRMALDRSIAPKLIVSLNGAFKPFEGLTGVVYPLFAKLLFANPLAARLLACRASPSSVDEIIRGTGSRIDRRGLDLYCRLISNSGHVSSVLAMMSHWNVAALNRDMSRLKSPLALVAATGDRAVPPDVATATRRLVPQARLERIDGLGHLAHEERPEEIVSLIERLACEAQVTACDGHGNERVSSC
jgi:magnesium chelatase accessory protein